MKSTSVNNATRKIQQAVSNIAITQKKGKEYVRQIIYTVSVPRVFSDKVTTDNDFTDEAVLQSNLPAVKNTFANDCDKQVLANKFWCDSLT